MKDGTLKSGSCQPRPPQSEADKTTQRRAAHIALVKRTRHLFELDRLSVREIALRLGQSEDWVRNVIAYRRYGTLLT